MSRNNLLSGSRRRPRWTIIGNLGCRRVARFQTALAAQGSPVARVVPYAELMTKPSQEEDVLESGTVVRLESAAEDWRTRRLLLKYGYECAWASGYPAAEPDYVDQRVTAHCPEFRPRQLYLGYRKLLEELEFGLDRALGVALQSPADIACMYDKWACQRRLESAGVAIPAILARPSCYEELRETCGPNGRYMLKMAHGSGGLGCVAMHWSLGRVRAFVSSQTMEMVAPEHAERRVPVQQIDHESVLARVVDALCRETAHLEAWLPKARFRGHAFDLRVVVIAGRARHAIARFAPSPFMNLNLGGHRQDLRELDRIHWDHLDDIVQQVGECFSRTLHFGLDLLLTSGGDFLVIDVNAFGDFLLDVYHEGQDPYAAEIDAVDNWLNQHGVVQKTPKVAMT